MQKNELILVLGGSRSGKSSWALRYAEKHYDSYLFLATAQVLDEEMAERVKRHKESRGPGWKVLEEPLEIAEALGKGCHGSDVVLVDCLTLWLSNVLLQLGEEHFDHYQEGFLSTISSRNQGVILVSNEVGMGIVPEYALSRRFRDLAGLLNQRVASLADRVVFLIAGLPVHLKGAPEETPF